MFFVLRVLFEKLVLNKVTSPLIMIC